MPNTEGSSVQHQLHETLETLEVEGHKLIPAGANTDLTDGQVLVWALVTHSVRLFSGVRALLREGLAHEASVLNRALLEAAVLLAHLMSNSDKFEEMRLRVLHDSLRELESLARFETELNMPGADEAAQETGAQRQALDQAFAHIGVQPGGLPDVREMLKRLGKEERYWYYKRASADVHAGVAALGSKMTQEGEGRFVASLRDDEKTALAIGMAAGDHFMSALIAASRILQWKTKDAIHEYRKGGDEALLKLGRDAGLRGMPPDESQDSLPERRR